MSQNDNIMEKEDKIDVALLVTDYLQLLRVMWGRVVVLALIGAALFGWQEYRNYEPYYTASTTFTINIRNAQGDVTNVYYDNSAAEQLAKTFPYILTSGALQRRVASELGVSYITGTIQASSVENTNLFTLSVQDKNPENAYNILQAVIKTYPILSESIVGKVDMKVLDESGIPSRPSNPRDLPKNAGNGAVIGAVLGLLWVLAIFFFHKTIRREEDCIKYLNQRCIGAIPFVVNKERSKEVERRLNITDEKIEPEFREAIRIIRNKVERSAKEQGFKTILITSSMPGEGKSTVAVNLALSLAQEGKRVLLMDADLRNPSDGKILGFEPKFGLIDFLKGEAKLKDCMYGAASVGLDSKMPFIMIPGSFAVEDGDNYLGNRRMKLIVENLEDHVDYLLIDSPPIGLLTDASLIAQYAEGVIFVIKKDYVKSDDVSRAIECIAEGKIHMIGCVLNGE